MILPVAWLALLPAACSLPVDEFVTAPLHRSGDGGDDTTTPTTDSSAGRDSAAQDSAVTLTDSGTSAGDTASAPTDTMPPPTDSTPSPIDSMLPPADSALPPPDGGTCRCVDCPGESRRCKTYDPPACGVFNGPC